MKVLAIVASPRQPGNCTVLVKAIAKEFSSDCSLTILPIASLRISPCKACYRCLFDDETCPHDDDYATYTEALLATDALIVAAPTYLLGAAGPLKLLQDRGLSLFRHVDTLWGTPAVGCAVAGIEEKEGTTLLDVQSFMKFAFTDSRRCEVFYGALPGEVVEDSTFQTKVTALASALRSPPPPSSTTTQCEHCGGDSFRVLDGSGRIRCLLCSAEGSLVSQAGMCSAELNAPGKQFFTTKEDVVSHLRWLRSEVARFSRERRQVIKRLRAWR